MFRRIVDLEARVTEIFGNKTLARMVRHWDPHSPYGHRKQTPDLLRDVQDGDVFIVRQPYHST